MSLYIHLNVFRLVGVKGAELLNLDKPADAMKSATLLQPMPSTKWHGPFSVHPPSFNELPVEIRGAKTVFSLR